MKENLPLAKKMVYVLVIFLLVGLTNNIMKFIFARARPIEFFENAVYGFKFFKFGHHFASFPSGHTMAITSMFYSLSKVWPKYIAPFMITAALIAFSRIVVGAHYLSDVFIGFIFSIYLVDFFDKHLKFNLRDKN
jgi:undecaprenyl-diphosphatase